MNKIFLIIQREYLSRVKKKSFLLATFLVPIIIMGLYGLMIYMTAKSFDSTSAIVHVYDESGVVADQLTSGKQIEYILASASESVDSLQKNVVEKGGKRYLLVIPREISDRTVVQLISSEKIGFALQSQVESNIQSVVRNHFLEKSGIDIETLNSIRPKVALSTKQITQDGVKDSSGSAAMVVSMALAILIYITLFIYGTQVMRGIIEEKNNRIVEVIISSVKPFQLMMGKIVGIGLVGLTQFLLWIILSGGLMTLAGSSMMNNAPMTSQLDQQLGTSQATASADTTGKILQAMESLNLSEIVTYFILFFLGGYLLYSALFAAVGSAVDSETETQQFIFPITMPLLFAYMLSFGVLVNDPHGSLAVWLSMIPLTSPVAMMVRIPYGVPTWEILLSLGLLVIGFIVTTWVAGKIYRVGILMYGKKASYKELIKWFKYKG